jgi:mono/diheme cytochrome c family protein
VFKSSVLDLFVVPKTIKVKGKDGLQKLVESREVGMRRVDMRASLRLIISVVVFAAGLSAATAVAQSEPDPERGGELYNQLCSMCHGEDGRGRVGASLEAFPGIRAASAIEQVIAQGIAGSAMPAWSEANGGPLAMQDITDITEYITGVLGGTQPVTAAPTYQPPEIQPLPDVDGDPTNGAIVFQANCAACHGQQAQGGFGWPLAKSWPGNRPEVYLHQVVAQGIGGTIMPGWAGDSGGPLTDEQIDDVSAYILTLSPVSGPSAPPPPESGPLTLTTSLTLAAILGVVVIIALVIYYRRA